MNRRDFIFLIPSVSLISLPFGNLREMYLRYVFPDRFKIRSVDESGTKHYDASYLDSQVNYSYYWNSEEQEHRFRITVFDGEVFNTHTVIQGRTDTLREAVEELEEDLVLPKSAKSENVDEMSIEYDSLLESEVETNGELPYTLD